MADLILRTLNKPGDTTKNSPLTSAEVDQNFINIDNELATKAPSESPALTGTPTAPTAAAGTDTTQIATTAFVHAERSNAVTLTNKTLNTPVITGTPDSVGELGTEGANLSYHDGTAARVIATINSAQTFVNKTLTTPVIAGTADANGEIGWSGNNLQYYGDALYTVANTSGAQVLTNKTVTDNTFAIQDDADNTKKAYFDASAISTSTSRTYTLPNFSGTLAHIGNDAQTFSGEVTLANATNTVGSSAATSTTNVGTGATASGNTKTINIGTGGLTGSTTAINFGSSTGTVTYTFNGPGAIQVPVGPEVDRPAAGAGKLRFNSTINKFEGHNGTSWSSVGGGATGGGADEIFIENGQTVTSSYTIPAGKNAMTTGPVTIADGAVVTISDGSRWVIL